MIIVLKLLVNQLIDLCFGFFNYQCKKELTGIFNQEYCYVVAKQQIRCVLGFLWKFCFLILQNLYVLATFLGVEDYYDLKLSNLVIGLT